MNGAWLIFSSPPATAISISPARINWAAILIASRPEEHCRLIAIVDEAASGLIRTAYTPSVKEYHDFCCALFDQKGNMLAHSTVTTAGFLGIVPAVMGNFLDSYPIDSFSSGDVLITNDPWLASGHLIDVTVAQPVFINDRVIGFALCIVHHLDMGGRMATLESKDMYEEGLKIPILKLFEGGVLNESIFEFIRANIRVPEKVLGDIRAQLIANHICSRGLINAMDEYEKALEAFEKALDLNPYVVDTWVNKGTVMWKAMGDREGALAAFDKALEINPNFMAAVDSRIALEAEIKANRPSFFKRLFGG